MGGALAGPSLQDLLEAVLAAWPGGRTFLSPSLAPRWSRRIADRGGDPRALDSLGEVPASADQIWLDLGGSAEDDESLAAFLAAAGARAVPPLVVLLRDDDPARAHSQRLAVDRPGRTLLLREAAGARAYALGRPELVRVLAAAAAWPADGRPIEPVAGAGGSLLVLDVDGVLIDPGRAFMEAVAGALAELAPDLAWHDEDYLRLKRAGGYNNDFRLAAGALAEQGADGALEAGIQAWEPACRDAVRRHYALTRRLERPMVTREQLAAAPGELALFTGRPPQELGYAFGVLGFTLPAVGDSAPHLRKPRPEGLIQLADAFRARRITFVGDSPDDAAALRGARALRPELDWRFGAVGADRARIALDGDLRAATLMDLIESGDLS